MESVGNGRLATGATGCDAAAPDTDAMEASLASAAASSRSARTLLRFIISMKGDTRSIGIGRIVIVLRSEAISRIDWR